MKRGDIYWATFPPPFGRRPAVVVTRTSAAGLLQWITVAAITTTVRGIPTEVPVGRDEGLPRRSVVNCDNVATVPKAWLDAEPVGDLGVERVPELDRALRFALEILY